MSFLQAICGATMLPLTLLTTTCFLVSCSSAEHVAHDRETEYLSLVKTKVEPMDHNDIVFVGLTAWGMQLSQGLSSFLRQFRLKDKGVVTLNTFASYSEGPTVEAVKQLCSKSTDLAGFDNRSWMERDCQFLAMKSGESVAMEREVETSLRTIKHLER